MNVSFLKKKNKESLASDEEDGDEGSLVKRPRARRRVVLDDKSNIPQNHPSDSVPFHLVDEPKGAPLLQTPFEPC